MTAFGHALGDFIKPFLGLTADQGAGSPEPLAPFNRGDLQPPFAQVKGRCLPPRSQPDDHHVIRRHMLLLYVTRFFHASHWFTIELLPIRWEKGVEDSGIQGFKCFLSVVSVNLLESLAPRPLSSLQEH